MLGDPSTPTKRAPGLARARRTVTSPGPQPRSTTTPRSSPHVRRTCATNASWALAKSASEYARACAASDISSGSGERPSHSSDLLPPGIVPTVAASDFHDGSTRLATPAPPPMMAAVAGRFEGRVASVVGAGPGIGRTCAMADDGPRARVRRHRRCGPPSASACARRARCDGRDRRRLAARRPTRRSPPRRTAATPRRERRRRGRPSPVAGFVAVVAPEPGGVTLVAAERGPIEPLPHGPEGVDARE